jgi:hypothetical protein
VVLKSKEKYPRLSLYSDPYSLQFRQIELTFFSVILITVTIVLVAWSVFRMSIRVAVLEIIDTVR